MHDVFVAIILGVVEGVTEFLPISSTGHLIIVNAFLGFSGEFGKLFSVVIQLGAVLAAIIYFRAQLIPSFRPQNNEHNARVMTLWKKVVVAVIPSLVLGALLGDTIDTYLFAVPTVAAALLVGGVVLIAIDRAPRLHTRSSIDHISYRLALGIGLFQVLALIPGTSRSAATIIGALLIGVARPLAAEFSFFLAIPTLCAASAYALLKYDGGVTMSQWGILLLGTVVSGVVAWIVIHRFMSFIRTRSFAVFGYYRIVLALVVLFTLVLR